MGSPHLPKLTTSLLHSYSEAAIRNADELLVESLLLRDHDHMARAYFLAVSCIEETGKALLAFDSQHRNLTDPAICMKLKTLMESHGQKINYALNIWAFSSPDRREAMKVALDLTFHVKHGREPSMYSDLKSDPDRVQTPREIVRTTAARECVRLAENCLAYAHRHVSEKIPAKFQEMLSEEDFWWYYISRKEAGQHDIAEAVLGYERDHIKTDKPFRAAQ
jgi:AbiV family abortive infection protein